MYLVEGIQKRTSILTHLTSRTLQLILKYWLLSSDYAKLINLTLFRFLWIFHIYSYIVSSINYEYLISSFPILIHFISFSLFITPSDPPEKCWIKVIMWDFYQFPILKLNFFFLFCFLGPHLQHMVVPRLGIELELQLPPYSTAITMWDPCHICNLHHSSWQCQILNPLSEARDQIHILMDPSWVHLLLSHKRNSDIFFLISKISIVFILGICVNTIYQIMHPLV